MANIKQSSSTNSTRNKFGCAIIGIVAVGVITFGAILFFAPGGPNFFKPHPPTATSPYLRLGVAAQQVNVTEKPDPNSRVLASYRIGTFINQVEILETSTIQGQDWYHIKFEDGTARVEGWVVKYYVYQAE